MADPLSDDHPHDDHVGGHEGSVSPMIDAEADVHPAGASADVEQIASDRDQTAADSDQTAADTDQSAADSDQSAADGDQSAADGDQAASDRDQVASDRAYARGGDSATHDLSRDVRDRGSEQRERAARIRAEGASARDAVAQARDLEALARDEAAAVRDRELAARDAAWASDGHPASGAEILLRAGSYRKMAAADRIAAAEFRARAAGDREQAARDREQAARAREQAQLEHDALLEQLTAAETDALTGARTRSAGIADLELEIDRARRTAGRLTVGYVDIVGLKAVNDGRGHTAGDALLKHAVNGIRRHMRPYDLVVRLGGDEFLCVMSDTTKEIALQRFAVIQATLANDPDPCSIRVGVATLAAQDGAMDLIARADAELPTVGRRS